MPQVPQHPRPGFFEREQKCSQMFQQGKDCGLSGGCCQMDTWLDQVGLRMRNIINKEDGEGKLKLYNNYDVRAHWDGFFRQRFKLFKFFNNKSKISPKRNLTPRLTELKISNASTFILHNWLEFKTYIFFMKTF